MGILDTKNILLSGDIKPVAAELHRVLAYERRGSLHDVADLCDVGYPTVYSEITRAARGDQQSIHLNTLRAAHFVTRSRPLAGVLVWPGLRITDEPLALEPTGSLEKEAGDVCIAAATLLVDVRHRAEDGVFCVEDERAITAQIEDGIKQLLDVQSIVKKAREAGGAIKFQ